MPKKAGIDLTSPASPGCHRGETYSHRRTSEFPAAPAPPPEPKPSGGLPGSRQPKRGCRNWASNSQLPGIRPLSIPRPTSTSHLRSQMIDRLDPQPGLCSSLVRWTFAGRQIRESRGDFGSGYFSFLFLDKGHYIK